MAESKADLKADLKAVVDRGEDGHPPPRCHLEVLLAGGRREVDEARSRLGVDELLRDDLVYAPLGVELLEPGDHLEKRVLVGEAVEVPSLHDLDGIADVMAAAGAFLQLASGGISGNEEAEQLRVALLAVSVITSPFRDPSGSLPGRVRPMVTFMPC